MPAHMNDPRSNLLFRLKYGDHTNKGRINFTETRLTKFKGTEIRHTSFGHSHHMANIVLPRGYHGIRRDHRCTQQWR